MSMLTVRFSTLPVSHPHALMQRLSPPDLAGGRLFRERQ